MHFYLASGCGNLIETSGFSVGTEFFNYPFQAALANNSKLRKAVIYRYIQAACHAYERGEKLETVSSGYISPSGSSQVRLPDWNCW
jgi:hypothetical protein